MTHYFAANSQRRTVVKTIAAALVAPSMKSLFSYGLLALVILLRPQGLLGTRSALR